MAVKRIVAPRQPRVPALVAPTHASAAGKITTNAPREFLAPKHTAVLETAPGRHSRPRFACGEDVEVRSRFSQVSAGKRQVVIYARAKVVSASAGTDSYLVQYPTANSIPSRTARVAASDVRAARRVPAPPESTVDSARPATSKRAPLSDRSQSGADDGCKKARRTGKGIPMDALLRFFQEHEEEQAKR